MDNHHPTVEEWEKKLLSRGWAEQTAHEMAEDVTELLTEERKWLREKIEGIPGVFISKDDLLAKIKGN